MPHFIAVSGENDPFWVGGGGGGGTTALRLKPIVAIECFAFLSEIRPWGLNRGGKMMDFILKKMDFTLKQMDFTVRICNGIYNEICNGISAKFVLTSRRIRGDEGTTSAGEHVGWNRQAKIEQNRAKIEQK